MIPTDRWVLWRQDDNGNRVRIAEYFSETAANAEMARFESLGHKQIYWLERCGALDDPERARG